MLRPLICCLASVALAAPVLAHDPGLSTVDVVVRDAGIEVVARVARDDLGGRALAADALELRAGGVPLTPVRVDRGAATRRGKEAVLSIVYPAREDGPLALRSAMLGWLPFGHKQYVRVSSGDGALLGDGVLSRQEPALELALVAGEWRPDSPERTGFAFLALGVEHILTGFDHLLFLFALLVVCVSWSAIVRIVTTFTVAHSITLIAATFGCVRVPATIVEPAIAGSIVAVAVLNLIGAGRPLDRIAITFGFGLIHGLGFAGLLAEHGVGSGGGEVALPLLAFNLGVELGQIAVAALALPLLVLLHRRRAFARLTGPVGSTAAAAFGLFWLAERMLA